MKILCPESKESAVFLNIWPHIIINRLILFALHLSLSAKIKAVCGKSLMNLVVLRRFLEKDMHPKESVLIFFFFFKKRKRIVLFYQ